MPAASQGNLDHTCALYALHHALSRVGLPDPYPTLVRGLSEAELRSAFLEGLPRTVVARLADSAREGTDVERLWPYWNHRPDLRTWWQVIQAHVHGGGAALIAIYKRHPDHTQWGHWTVVTRATERTLALEDSSGLKCLRRRQCGIDRNERVSAARPYRIEAGSTLLLWRRDSE